MEKQNLGQSDCVVGNKDKGIKTILTARFWGSGKIGFGEVVQSCAMWGLLETVLKEELRKTRLGKWDKGN